MKSTVLSLVTPCSLVDAYIFRIKEYSKKAASKMAAVVRSSDLQWFVVLRNAALAGGIVAPDELDVS
jgi:hypothetical protein